MSDSGSQSQDEEEEYNYESLPQQFKDIMNHSLRTSCVNGHEVWVSSLLAKGADVNSYAPNDNSKTTALHIAVQNLRSNLVQLLVPKVDEENKERARAITSERIRSLVQINELLGGSKQDFSVQPATEKAPSNQTSVDTQIAELRKANETSKKALEDYTKAALKKESEAKASIEAITKELEAERAARRVVDQKIQDLATELKDKAKQVENMDEKLQAGAKERQTLKNKIRLAAVAPGAPTPPQFSSHPNFTFKGEHKKSASMIASAPSTPTHINKSPGPTKNETKDDMDLEEPVKSRVRRLVTRWETIKDVEEALGLPASGTPKSGSDAPKPSSPKANSESPRAHQ